MKKRIIKKVKNKPKLHDILTKYKQTLFECSRCGIINEKRFYRLQKPNWCNYINATSGIMGCWSLVSGKVINELYCNKCEFYNIGGNI